MVRCSQSPPQLNGSGHDDTCPRRQGHGIWAIAIIILLVVAVSLIFKINQTAFKLDLNGKITADSVPFDEAKALMEYQQVGEVFTHAVGNRTDLGPVRDAVRRLIERYPQFVPAQTLYAQVLLKRGDFSEAYDQFQHSLELDGEQAEIHLVAGSIAYQLKRFDRAKHHYSMAIGLNASKPTYRLHLARVHLQLNQLDEARDLIFEALNLDSSLHMAYGLLADVYLKQNKTQLALTQIQRAIDHVQSGTRQILVHYIRKKAFVLRRDNRPGDALVILQNLHPDEQTEPLVIEDMALCWSMTGQFDKAAEQYDHALADNLTDSLLLIGAARWHIKAGHHQIARKLVDRLQYHDPSNPAIPKLLSQDEIEISDQPLADVPGDSFYQLNSENNP